MRLWPGREERLKNKFKNPESAEEALGLITDENVRNIVKGYFESLTKELKELEDDFNELMDNDYRPLLEEHKKLKEKFAPAEEVEVKEKSLDEEAKEGMEEVLKDESVSIDLASDTGYQKFLVEQYNTLMKEGN